MKKVLEPAPVTTEWGDRRLDPGLVALGRSDVEEGVRPVTEGESPEPGSHPPVLRYAAR